LRRQSQETLYKLQPEKITRRQFRMASLGKLNELFLEEFQVTVAEIRPLREQKKQPMRVWASGTQFHTVREHCVQERKACPNITGYECLLQLVGKRGIAFWCFHCPLL
jgi:hypothetical protein